MNTHILIVLSLNFVISMIGTLAYAVRIVGVRTGRVAVSFALFNVLMLISRTATSFQVPLLTKYVEKVQNPALLASLFYEIIIISGVATIVGAVMIPTFQSLFCKGVQSFSIERSISKLIIHSFTKVGVSHLKECVSVPAIESITKVNFRRLPIKIILFNTITVALITVGSLAPIYAVSIEPELRATCITLSPIINGIATILMSIFIDPQLSVMTDDVIEGNCTHEDFKDCVVAMVGSKTIGTFLALAILIPSANIIVMVAKLI